MCHYALARAHARLGVQEVVVLPNALEGRVFVDGKGDHAYAFGLGDEVAPDKDEQEKECVRLSFTARNVPLLVRRELAQTLLTLRARVPITALLAPRKDLDALVGIELVPAPLGLLYEALGMSEREGHLLTLM